MPVSPGHSLPEVAVFYGGPMDGKEHPATWDTDELCVVMTSGEQHRYVRTERLDVSAGGRSASVFEYRGRFYGPM
jgi:hypothetical protein